MVEVIWTEPALAELDAIADCIELDNPTAAHRLVDRVFTNVQHLATHPRSGTRLRELDGDRYRQLIEPPCRIVYRVSGNRVYAVLVMRTEQQAPLARLAPRKPRKSGRR